ncbi:hypothetical protein [Salmonella phage SSBI34]|nr:hypothetical protein [Salmonella phage SSBI34]
MRKFQYILTIDLDDEALNSLEEWKLFRTVHGLSGDGIEEFAKNFIPGGIEERIKEDLLGKTTHRVTYAGELK